MDQSKEVAVSKDGASRKERRKEKKDTKDKSERKDKDKKHKSSSSSSKPKSSEKSTSAAANSTTNVKADAESTKTPKEEPLPDMTAINKLDPSRGILSFLEQHSKEAGSQQAFVYGALGGCLFLTSCWQLVRSERQGHTDHLCRAVAQHAAGDLHPIEEAQAQ